MKVISSSGTPVRGTSQPTKGDLYIVLTKSQLEKMLHAAVQLGTGDRAVVTVIPTVSEFPQHADWQIPSASFVGAFVEACKEECELRLQIAAHKAGQGVVLC